MHVISPKTLREFWETHPQAREPLRAWRVVAHAATWQTFVDVRERFPSADLVGRLTVFNISGNNYRLIVRIEFTLQRIYVRHVLTHAEYDKERWKNDPWY